MPEPPFDLEHKVTRQIVADYRKVWADIEKQLSAVVAKIEKARAAGEEITRAWLLQQARLNELGQLVEQEIGKVDRQTAVRMEHERQAVVARGATEAYAEMEKLGLTPRKSWLAPERILYRRNIPALFQQSGATAGVQARRVLLSGLVRGRNPRAVARDLRNTVGSSMARSLTIARTEMLTAYRDSALDTYRANSDIVQEWEWLAEPDACDFCQDMNGERMPLEDDFDTHPNAVLAGTTFAPYGQLIEMVAARYSGPAATVRVDGHAMTIGPNHPMLTQRGMVPAKLLREGDELVYDLRHDWRPGLATRGKAHLKEIPLVEDAFATVKAHCPNTLVTAARYDFHGDRVFCQGKVNIVRANRELLPILDPSGIEQRGESDFMLTDTELPVVAAVGASDSRRKGVPLSATSSMSGSGSGGGHFLFLPVEDVDCVTFNGWAFDASTNTSLYCSDGFVVKNCRCSPLPVTEMSG